jgi:asparagine synthase (glutamine-hydrolysing)
MCGISFYCFNRTITPQDITLCLDAFFKTSHRGPDTTNFKIIYKCNIIICFHRLSINDTSSNGDQPFMKIHNNEEYYLICNGEIYNHNDIEIKSEFKVESNSDCECLLNEMIRTDMNIDFNTLNSEHAMIGIKIKQDNTYELVISVDRFSIRPLFIGETEEVLFFSSELQGIPTQYDNIIISRFESSHYMKVLYDGKFHKETVKYFNLRSIPKVYRSFNDSLKLVREVLSQSVIKRLRADVPIGAYLSGGLDSITVCIEASTYLKQFGKSLKTFCVGLQDSEDLIFANLAAKELNTDHTNIIMTKEEYLNLIPLVIEANGSFCTTTTRASIGQLKGAMEISKTTDIKVIISGDGSDELNFSYNDAYDCPTNELFEDQTFNLLENIHTSDGLRADRCTAKFGLELRLPFLDKDFINLILESDINHRISRNKISKPLLRYAYKDILPDNIIFRPKVTFSDGMASKENSTQKIMSEYFNNMYTEDEFNNLRKEYLFHCPPETKEQLYYRQVFCKLFGNNESVAKTIPHFWKPRFRNTIDPSAWFNEDK